MARRLTLSSVAFALIAAACGGSVAFDTRDLEAALPAAVLPEAPDLVTDVACEDPLPVEATSVTCALVIVDTPTNVDATVSGDGVVTAELDLEVLSVAVVGEELAARLEADLGTGAVVACDRPVVRVVEVGEEIRCLVTDPGGTTRTFIAVITDADGRFTIRLDE